MVLQHSGPDGGYVLDVRRPAAGGPLSGLVSSVEDFTEWSAAPLRRREVAIPQVVLILDLDGHGWQVDGERHRSFAAGLCDRPTLVEHGGRARCMQVNLTPLGARALLGVPGRSIAGATVALEELGLGPLVERLAVAPSASDRFALLSSSLARRVASAEPVRPDVAWAWRRLVLSGGAVRVEDLAAELGCSRRHLSGRFGEELGLGPKAFARVLRFGRALRALLDGGERGLAAVAASCGYADQSHLTREFRALAGLPPTELLRSRIAGGAGLLG